MLDAGFVSCLKEELNQTLKGGRIEKIRQPAKDVLILTVRTREGKKQLLLSASPGKARAHLTETDYGNPAEPPMFCMLLRKHITGAEILSFEQPGEDRLLEMQLRNYDDLGRDSRETLVLEMMPGKTNLILVGEDGLIIDCVYRRDYDRDMYRRLFPGMIYRLPQQPENYVHKEPEPFRSDEFSTLSAFLDAYYSVQERDEVYRRKGKELRTSLSSAEKRIRKKLAAQRIELQRTETREELRRKADLITANIYRIRKGDASVECSDFYQEGSPLVTIELDPLLPPQKNAAKLYKEYNRQKTAREYLTVLIEKAEAQLEYIASAQEELSRASSEKDIAEIRDELIASEVIRDRKKKNTKNPKKEKPQAPIRLLTGDGYEVFAGRNNVQNDMLTFSQARRTDLWLHVKNLHGSHVIIRCENTVPPEETVLQAAALAVWNSQGRESENVAVDITEARHVKKPSGALPGKVIYTDYRTVIVNRCKDLLPAEMTGEKRG